MQEKSKILYIDTPLEPPGGGQHSLRLLIDNLNKDVYEIVVFVPYDCRYVSDLKAAGIKVRIIPLMSLFSAIKSESPSVVHCNSPTTRYSFFAALTSKVLKIPFLWHLRVLQSGGLKERIISALSERIIVISDAVAYKFRNTKSEKKIIKVYNGVDTEKFRLRERSKQLMEEFGLSTNDFIIGAMGRFDSWKEFCYFIQMAGIIVKEMKNCQFLIVGGGREEKRLKSEASQLGLTHKIIFTGYRNDVPDILSLFDVFVHPSSQEAFGRVIVEAMASGKPVVAVDAAGPREIINSGVDGILVPPKPSEMARAVLGLLKDRELYLRFAKSARTKAEEVFNIKNTAKKIEKIYEELIRQQ